MAKLQSFNVRRRFAKASFASILFTLASCLAIAAFGDEGAANRLLQAGAIIGPIVVCLTGVIGQYAHLVYKTDAAEKKDVAQA